MKKFVVLAVAITLGIALPTDAATIVNDGSALLGYWEFNETTGTTAVDSSGNANTAVLDDDNVGESGVSVFNFDNNSVSDRFGNPSGALHFRGLLDLAPADEKGWVYNYGDYARVADSPTLDAVDGITITAWVKMPAIAKNWTTLVSKEKMIWNTPTGDGYTLMVTGNGDNGTSDTKNIVSSWCANGPGWTGTYYANGVDDDLGIDTWQFIAMVADGTTLQAYVNGVADGSAVAMSPAPTSTAGTDLILGFSPLLGRCFAGDVDEIAIWDGAMSATEIADVYTNGVVVAAPEEPIPGDANGDKKVDGSDVTILAGNWQVGVDGTVEATWEMGDFNGDKKVDGSDVTILAGNWQYGVTAAAAAVPEPSAMLLICSAIVGLLAWRRVK